MKKQLNMWNLTKNKDDSADLILYGDIGESWLDDVSSKNIANELKNLDVSTINLRINSGGGDVFSAIAISNLLKNHKANIIAHIDGLAASAATIITSACDKVIMPKNALFMIHNPWTVVGGEAKDMIKTAEQLDKVKNSIINTYKSKTNLEIEEISKLMDEETWLDPYEAKEKGFIDEISDEENIEVIENKLIVNSIALDFSKFKNSYNKKLKIKNEEEKIVNKEEFKNNYPELYEEIKNEGILQERTRIKEIDELGINNEIITNAKFVEILDVKDVAIKLIKDKSVNIAEGDPKLENIKNSNKVIVNTLKDEDNDIRFSNMVLNSIKLLGGNK